MMTLARQQWPEDEITSRVATLGALVASPVVAVTTDTPISEVRALFIDRRVAAIAVVDDDALVGILTRTDVLGVDLGTAEAVMSRYILALPAIAPVERAAALMTYEGVGVIAVYDAGEGLVGLVSAADIVRHYATEAGYLV